MAPLAALALLAALGGGSCSLTRDDEPLGLPSGGAAVHSVLVAGSDTVSVYIVRAAAHHVGGFDGSVGFAAGADPIEGADVRIISGADTLDLPEAPAGFRGCYTVSAAGYSPETDPEPAGSGCYAAVLPGGVRVGVRYELLITLPGGDVVQGAAVVPEAPVLLAPEAWSQFRENPSVDLPEHAAIEIPVRWTPPTPTAVAVNVGATRVFSGGAPVAGGSCRVVQSWPYSPLVTGDSVRLDIDHLACREPGDSTDWLALRWDSVHARVQTTVYDTAYARYATILLSGTSARADEAAAGLTGALGVFAGAAAADRPITILPSQAASAATAR